MLATYAAAGHTVLVVTHDVELARRIAHVATHIASGRIIAQGDPADALAHVEPDSGQRDRPTTVRAPRPLAPDLPALVARAATLRRGGRPVIAPVDLAVRAGEIVGITGPSGSGKSTLAALLARINKPDSGHVELGGVKTTSGLDLTPAERRRVAWVSQHPRQSVDPRLSLRRTIELPARLAGISVDAVALASRLGLDSALLERRPHEVSGGELQRACLARAVALGPEFLVLDEITSMLNRATATDILGFVAAEASAGTGVLLVGHDVAALHSVCDRVLALRPSNDGAVFCEHDVTTPRPHLTHADPPTLRQRGSVQQLTRKDFT
ncbi:ATP-binding cassette domain-containing protein [Rhodococcus ruber]|nr:ATP-binding cassette domain-containing protein [Rhodococcus ruber]